MVWDREHRVERALRVVACDLKRKGPEGREP